MRKLMKILGGVVLLGIWGVALTQTVSPGALSGWLQSVQSTPREGAQTNIGKLYTLEDEAMPLAGTAAQNGKSSNGRLRVSGGQLQNEAGEPFQLRGMSSHGIAWFPEYLSAASINTTKAYGANLFRVSMYADFTAGNYTLDLEDQKKNKALLYDAVDNALRADMYAIVDWHILEVGNPLIRIDSAIAFFDEVSQRYADEPGVLYEICNEPNGSTTWSDVVNYANRVIPVIRGNSPEAVILVGTPDYATDLNASMKAPLPYDNIMYTYHYYTSGGDIYQETLETALSANHPVFVSEWGVEYEGDDAEEAVTRAGEFVAFLNARGISWANWSLSNKEESYSAIRAEVETDGGWTYEDLTPGGQVVFEALDLLKSIDQQGTEETQL